MDLKIVIWPFMLMMSIGSAFATDAVDATAVDLEAPNTSNEDQTEENEESRCGYFTFFSKGWKGVKVGGRYVFDKLGSQQGATFLGVAYSLEQAVANFMWGFNWAEHANASPNTHMIIQELGAMLVVAGCVIAGILIPIAVYSYNLKHPQAQQPAS